MDSVHIAVDLGSSNGKIVMASITDDKKVKTKEIGRFATPRIHIGGHLHTDIYHVYEQICSTLSTLGSSGIAIKSLGVDSWSTDYGIIDQAGKLQGLPYFYRDTRTRGILENVILSKISFEELYKLSSQRRIPDSSLCQILATLRDDPNALSEGKKILFISDILMYFLTGVPCAEFSVASYSQMYNMKKMDWEDKIFELFNIPKSCRPQVIHAGHRIGPVNESFAKWYGTNIFDVIAPATHDTSSAGVAVPVTDETSDWAFIATGTWYLVGMQLDSPADDTLSCKYNLTNTGFAFKKTLLKYNVSALWPIQECKRLWNMQGIHYSYSDILEAAKKAKPFAAMINADDLRFFNPTNMPVEIANYLFQSGQIHLVPDDVGQIARIIYECIALKCAYAIETLKSATKRKHIHRLYIVGGGSTISYLNQFIANATGLEVITGPQEASSIGNALLQSYGCGDVSSLSEIRQIVANTVESKHFYPEDTQIWQKQLHAYCDRFNLTL